MEIEKLKQKILDLAIRGKLVSQDPDDEPASVLIERIREEKEKLIKEGKIKRDKNESYIYRGSDNCYYEKYGELPSNWQLVKFGEVVNIRRGASPRPIKEHLTDEEDGISWIKIGDTKPGDIYINQTQQKIKKTSVAKSVFLEKGTLVLSNSMSFGRPYILNIDGCIHDGWLSIKPYGNTINIEFLQIILQGYMWYFKNKATGTGVDNLNIDRVYEMPFALPPIKEQERILKELIKVDEKLKTLHNNIDKLNVLIEKTKYKILDYYFGDDSCYKSYYENNYTLGDILTYEQPGPFIVKNTDYNDKYNIPVLTPGKTFILGYTNEKAGIYNVKNSKVIIFDDFTTASKLVDFDFKVKSSAMKILSSSNTNLFDIDYMYFLIQTINVISDTHKRYWISEYMPMKLKIHTIVQQKKIVNKIKQIFTILDSMSNSM